MLNLTTALVFGENMVLQRGKSVPVWGTGIPGQKVTVRIQGKSTETIVHKDGVWSVKLPPLCVSTNETMTICSGQECKEYHNVLMGDVWIAGGQSNMEFGMYSDSDFEKERAICENDKIRFFDFPKISYEEQMIELPHNSEGFWRKCKQ